MDWFRKMLGDFLKLFHRKTPGLRVRFDAPLILTTPSGCVAPLAPHRLTLRSPKDPEHTTNVRRAFRCGCQSELAQFRVFGLGILQNGDVRVGVFPKREEVFIGALRLS